MAVAATAGGLIYAVSAVSGSDGRTSNVARPPAVLAVDYGRFRPEGADGSYNALRIRTRDRDAQVVTVEVARRGPVIHADGGCNTGGKASGDTTTWTIPTTLSPGRHRLRITAESSSCDSRAISESTTATVRIRVRG